MNKTKTILLSILMFGAGAATGYYICKRRLEDMFSEEMDEYKAYLDEKYGVEADDEDEDEEEPDKDEKTEQDRLKMNNLINQELYKSDKGKPRTNYNKPSMNELAERMAAEEADDGPPEEPEEPDEEDRDADYEAELEAAAEAEALNRQQAEMAGEPYLIEYDEYVDGVEGYEAQSLYFYTKDGVMCEDDDTPVSDYAKLVGYDFERKLEMQTSAFVRNDSLMMLYEIHRITRSYEKEVLGISETPRERELRITGRRKAAKDGE